MKRKRLRLSGLLPVLATALLAAAGCGTDGEELLPDASEAPLFINEFLAFNGSGLADPDFEGRSDWIELYNAGGETVDLEGFSLEDDPGGGAAWSFPAGASIAPGGFLLVWADEKDTVAAAYHAGFKLNADGEAVVLRDAAGLIADRIEFDEQEEDVSSGRAEDGGSEWALFRVPTPGASNTGSAGAPAILSIRQRPVTPAPSDSVRVFAVIAFAESIEATLVWTPGGGWIETPLAPAGPDTFAAAIPPFPEETAVSYWVSAADTAGIEVRSPPHAPSGTFGYVVGSPSPPVFVNEFLAGNSGNAADPDFDEFGDWIELFNAGDRRVDLDGWFLSDDPGDLFRWTFPERTIVEPGEFLIVWADDEDTVGAALHANFRVDKDGGESILLTHRSGARIDSVPVGPQTTDVSEGRTTDGGAAWSFFDDPTPGAPNAGAGGNEAPLFLSAELVPDPPAPGESPLLTAVIADPEGVVAAVFTNDGAGWRETAMTAAAGTDTFTAALPAGPGGTPVDWYIRAEDALAAAAYDPPAGPLAPRRYVVPGSAPAVRINEFLAANSSGAVDPDYGETGDWIELFNAEDSTVVLSGWTLTDDPAAEASARWTFPAGVSIGAGGRMLLWADGRDTAGAALHADFKLGVGGESILLFDAAGDRADGITYGAQRIDVSYGRTPDGGEAWTFFETPTPGAANP